MIDTICSGILVEEFMKSDYGYKVRSMITSYDHLELGDDTIVMFKVANNHYPNRVGIKFLRSYSRFCMKNFNIGVSVEKSSVETEWIVRAIQPVLRGVGPDHSSII